MNSTVEPAQPVEPCGSSASPARLAGQRRGRRRGHRYTGAKEASSRINGASIVAIISIPGMRRRE